MSNLSIVFLIQRLGDFRYLGSVIEAASERGHKVELWHDYSRPRGGNKDYQYPLIENTPPLNATVAASLTYGSQRELRGMLDSHSPDSVVASRGKTDYLSPEDTASLDIPWVGVQEHVDYALFGLDRITSATIQCLFTPYWLTKILELYSPPTEREALLKRLKGICKTTGSTQADGAKLINPDEVRMHWGIPSDRPVVVYLPLVMGASLYNKVLFSKNRIIQAAYLLRARLWRNLGYLSKPFSDKAMVNSVREFCDRNNAFLLVKTRKKQPLPEYLKDAADCLIFDETEYPTTILKALSVADLCISAYPSSSINDAAAVKVPFLCFYRDTRHWAYSHSSKGYVKHPSDVFLSMDSGIYFNHPGFGYVMRDLDGIRNLPQHSLSSFPLDDAAWESFVDNYLGSLDGCNGHRVIREVENLVVSPNKQMQTV